jgi:hypothetical protein
VALCLIVPYNDMLAAPRERLLRLLEAAQVFGAARDVGVTPSPGVTQHAII